MVCAQIAAASQGAPRRRSDRPSVRGGRRTRRALSEGLAEALRRFETGVYIAWYPIKDPKPIAAFHGCAGGHCRTRAAARGAHDTRTGNAPDRLNGCGLIVANPPYTLRDASRSCAARADASSGRRQRSAPSPRPHRADPARHTGRDGPFAPAKDARRAEGGVQRICLARPTSIIDTRTQFEAAYQAGRDCRDCTEMTCADASTLSRAPHFPRRHRMRSSWLHARRHAC